MGLLQKSGLAIAVLGLLLTVAGLAAGSPELVRPAALTLTVGLAFGLGAFPPSRGYQFTAWIVAAVVAGMTYPAAFLHWGNLDLRSKWVILFVVQAVMFGMGTQMSLRDFAGIARAPRGVLVGIICPFTVMPLVALSLTRIFHFPAEIAAGIILIGSCSSGLASNVMSYLARANLPLSVTVTAVSTMLAPFLTPLWMKFLAGTLVEVSFFKMMIEICEIVIVPIGAALLHDYLKHASAPGRRRVWWVAATGVLWLAVQGGGGWTWLAAGIPPSGQTAAALLNFLLGAVAAGLGYHWLTLRFTRLDRLAPLASMAGIVYFITVTTAAGRDNLLQVGLLLFLASVIHNGAGYFFGYWLSRGAGLDRNSARSVAFEVGLQNGGMASGLAGAMGKLGTVGLAAAIFSPWMNISGSILANYWKRRPPPDSCPSGDEAENGVHGGRRNVDDHLESDAAAAH